MIKQLSLSDFDDDYLGIPHEKLLGMLKPIYKDYELILNAYRSGIKNYDYSTIKYAEYAVERFRFARRALNDYERIIIDNEFFGDPKKQWYREYFSKNTYYTKRQHAYFKFVDNLKQ